MFANAIKTTNCGNIGPICNIIAINEDTTPVEIAGIIPTLKTTNISIRLTREPVINWLMLKGPKIARPAGKIFPINWEIIIKATAMAVTDIL